MDSSFKKIKKAVQKHHPQARTVPIFEGQAIVGYKVCDGLADVVDPELMLPMAVTVRKAWENAKYSVWWCNMMRKSNNAFNEEKALKQIREGE